MTERDSTKEEAADRMADIMLNLIKGDDPRVSCDALKALITLARKPAPKTEADQCC